MADGNQERRDRVIAGQFAFLWSKSECGYVWRDDVEPQDTALDSQGPWLTIADPWPWGLAGMSRQYAPMRRAKLHRNLAKRDPNRLSSLASFANQYGPLTRGVPTVFDWPAESHQMWAETIGKLHELITVWDLVDPEQGGPKTGPLGQHVVWEGHNRVVWKWGGRTTPIAQRGDGQGFGVGGDLIERWKFPDLVRPALFYIARSINHELVGQASPVLLPERHKDIQIIPHSLRAALFVLLAHEVAGRKMPQTACQHCANLFTPDDPRQRYCSRSCRNAKWYLDNRARTAR